MGFVHLQRGEVDEAITALHKALTWDPRYVQARATFASALYMKGEYEKSAEMSRMVLKEQPAFGPAWNNHSLATFELGDVQKAKEYAEKAYEFGYDVSDEYWKELKEAAQKA
jgi:tetratricopeptide (TPR) repeat protein